MSKFLYITDQMEHKEHSFIGPLFEKYLTEHYEINIIYFSKTKTNFDSYDNKFIIPHEQKTNTLSILEKNGVNLGDYDFIAVRNDTDILKEVIQKRSTYNYKVAFRLSYPKRIAKLQKDEANNKKSFLDVINNKIKLYGETNLINDCDIFLPTSRKMRDDYLKKVKTRTFVIPSGIDPEVMTKNIQHEGVEKRFFYAGTLDKLREFQTILDAFSELSDGTYKIMISSKDPQYTQNLIDDYESIKDHIEIYNAKSKDELLDLIAKADIGLALLPDIELFNSSTPMKVLDYYSSAVPCIMSKNENNESIFVNDTSAWMCDFTKKDIKEKLDYILGLNKDEVAQIGLEGQARLLAVRNYKRIADDLAHQLNIL
jgi:glycosyltransferase involved in cell wall biosynthesis